MEEQGSHKRKTENRYTKKITIVLQIVLGILYKVIMEEQGSHKRKTENR